MKYKWILGIDPSGAFTEGKGTTGLCLIDADTMNIIYAEDITARTFDCKENYWDHHLKTIQRFLISKRKDRRKNTIIVMEDYILYGNKAMAQINSRMETPKLIGIIQHWCFQNEVDYTMQLASEVKSRWNDEILEYKGFIKKKSTRYNYNDHIRDSIRHAVHYGTFKNGRDE